jgi:predicted flap endonuclease-1-like 5' DNA nuclease
MLLWAQTYWYLCLIALIIGVLTAAWIWLRADASLNASADLDDGGIRPVVAAPVVPLAPAPLAPVRPVVDVAEPVRFAAPPPPPAAAPVAPAMAAAVAIPAAIGAPDDLTFIKGVGPKLNALLISLGVLRFDQIAAWGASEIAEVDQHLGSFKGRITRDSWVEQSGLLARGDHAAFAAKFGEVGSENK